MISNKPIVKKNTVKKLLMDMSEKKIKHVMEMENKDQNDIYNCFNILDNLEALSWKDAQKQ